MGRRDNNPLDAFLIRKIEKMILAAYDVKTGRANFRFRKIGQQDLVLRLHAARLRRRLSWQRVDDYEASFEFQGAFELRQHLGIFCQFVIDPLERNVVQFSGGGR